MKPNTTHPTDEPTVDRRRVLGWVGGIGAVALLGGAVVQRWPAPVAAAEAVDGLVGQRLVYAHLEADEHALEGHAHDPGLYVRAADFDRPSSLDAVVAYPERLVGDLRYAVLVHRLDAAAFGPPTDPDLAAGDLIAYSGVCPECGSLLRFDAHDTATGRGVDRCPVHGCEFDPYRGGRVMAGAATEPLDQFGIALDDAGVLVLTTAEPGHARGL
jgi:nitrite reductase/ring-hydroxylating ferredoxin subunit